MHFLLWMVNRIIFRIGFYPSDTSSYDLPMGIIGGVNLKLSAGNYDLSDLGYLSYAIAASSQLTIEGSLSFGGTTQLDELLFISGSAVDIIEGSTVDFSGRSLGFGSFDSLDIINVGLSADEEIGVRSLDSILIENSTFATVVLVQTLCISLLLPI